MNVEVELELSEASEANPDTDITGNNEVLAMGGADSNDSE